MFESFSQQALLVMSAGYPSQVSFSSHVTCSPTPYRCRSSIETFAPTRPSKGLTNYSLLLIPLIPIHLNKRTNTFSHSSPLADFGLSSSIFSRMSTRKSNFSFLVKTVFLKNEQAGMTGSKSSTMMKVRY